MTSPSPPAAPGPQNQGTLQQFVLSAVTTGRRSFTRLKWQVRRVVRQRFWGDLARIYTWLLTLPTVFSGFWIILFVFTQLSDPKQDAIKLFPNGLNDAAALIPISLAGFTALLFSAQAGSKANSRRAHFYGRAANRFLHAVYFLSTSFVLGTGSRFLEPNAFDGWKLATFLNEIAKATPSLVFINALVAGVLLLRGLHYFIKTIGTTD